MNKKQKGIDLAHHINAPAENVQFEIIRSTENGAYLYHVWDFSGEHRYIIEGETGEMLEPMECTENEAIEIWEG